MTFVHIFLFSVLKALKSRHCVTYRRLWIAVFDVFVSFVDLRKTCFFCCLFFISSVSCYSIAFVIYFLFMLLFSLFDWCESNDSCVSHSDLVVTYCSIQHVLLMRISIHILCFSFHHNNPKSVTVFHILNLFFIFHQHLIASSMCMCVISTQFIFPLLFHPKPVYSYILLYIYKQSKINTHMYYIQLILAVGFVLFIFFLRSLNNSLFNFRECHFDPKNKN